jgi:hypothetical protein
VGLFPELQGTVPEIIVNDRVINPVPEKRDLESAGGWRAFGPGIAAGLTDWVDVGFSLARGLHSTVRLIESREWALSVSPAYFRHVERADVPEWTRVTNLNLTGLIAYRPLRFVLGRRMDVFAGGGQSWYEVEIRDQWRKHRSTASTIVGGVTLDAGPSRAQETAALGTRVSVETAVTFLEQRDGRHDFVVTNRIQLALRRLSAW